MFQAIAGRVRKTREMFSEKIAPTARSCVNRMDDDRPHEKRPQSPQMAHPVGDIGRKSEGCVMMI